MRVRSRTRSGHLRGVVGAERLEDRRLLAIDFPIPMLQHGPGAFSSTVNGFVSELAATQDFTISLHGGQAASIVLSPTDEFFAGGFELLSPSGNVLGTSPVSSGELIHLTSVDLAMAGEYTVRVSSLENGAGNFDLAIGTNLVYESSAEQANHQPASAYELTPTFEPVAGSQMISVIGKRPSSAYQSIFDHSFETSDLPVGWSTFSSAESGRIRVTDEFAEPGNFALWMDQAPDPSPDPNAMPADVDAAVVYDPATGRLRVSSVFPLSTLQMTSASGVFTAIEPMNLDGFADVLRSDLLFHLDSTGYTDVDFGTVLPTGLSQSFLQQDLSFNGSLLGGGVPRVAVGNGKLRAPVLNEVTMEFDLSQVSSARLEYDQFAPQPAHHFLPSEFEGRVEGNGVAVSADGQYWYSVKRFLDAFGTIDLTTIQATTELTWEDRLFVRFQQFDNGTMPEEGIGFDNIRLVGLRDTSDWYRVSLNDGDVASFRLTATATAQSISLYDASLNKIYSTPTSSPVQAISDFRDTSENGIPDNYFLEVPGLGFDYSLSLFKNGSFNGDASYLDDRTPIHIVNRYAESYLPADQGPFTVETYQVSGGELGATVDPVLVVTRDFRDVDWDDNSADGVNARIELDPEQAGTYRFEVTPGVGRIGLAFDGLADKAYAATYTSPADQAYTNSAVHSVQLLLDGPFRLDTMSEAPFVIDGMSVDYSIDSRGRLNLLPEDSLQHGTHRVQIAAGAVQRLSGQPNEAIDFEFFVDTQPPAILSSTIYESVVVAPGRQRHTVQFTEPMGAAFRFNARRKDGTVFEPSIVSIDGDLLTFDLDLPEGDYTLSLGDSGFSDLAGNRLDGEAGQFPTGDGRPGGFFEVSFIVDQTLAPVDFLNNENPFPFATVSREHLGVLSSPSDTDSFMIPHVPAGTPFAIRVVGDDLVRPKVRLFDPVGALIAEQVADLSRPVVMQHHAATTGDYSFDVSQDGGAPGNFTGSVILHGTFEAEEESVPANDDLLSATSIENLHRSLSHADTSFAAIVGNFNRTLGVTNTVESFDDPLANNWSFAGSAAIEAPSVAYSVTEPQALAFNGNGEVVARIDVGQADRTLLTFAMMERGASEEPLPDLFEGSVSGDGIAASVDGQNWVRIFDFPDQSYEHWYTHTVDVADAFASAGVAAGGTIYIKFQNTGPQEHRPNRFIDSVRIGTKRDDVDWYKFELSDGELASIDVRPFGDHNATITLDLFDENQTHIVSAAADNGAARVPVFRDHTSNSDSDTYYVRVTGDHEYSLLLTRGTVFDVGSDDLLTVMGDHLNATIEISGPVRADSFSQQILFPEPIRPDASSKGWVFYSELAAIKVYRVTDAGFEFHQTLSMPPDWSGYVVANSDWLYARENFGERIEIFRLDERQQWIDAGYADPSDTTQLRAIYPAHGAMFILWDLAPNRTELTEFNHSGADGQWTARSSLPARYNSSVHATENYLLVDQQIYEESGGGDWVATYRLDDNAEVIAATSDSILAIVGGEVHSYNYSPADLTWVPTVELSANADSGFSVDDGYVVVEDYDRKLRSFRQRNGDWYADPPFDLTGAVDQLSPNGILRFLPQVSGPRRIDSWQKQIDANVPDAGSLVVDATLVGGQASDDAVVSLVVFDESSRVVAETQLTRDQPAAQLQADNLPAGHYAVFVRRESGYAVVQVDVAVPNAFPDPVSPVSISPADGQTTDYVPRFVTMEFLHPINTASADPLKVTLAGQPATRFETVKPNELRVYFDSESLVDGAEIIFESQADAFRTLDGAGNAYIRSSFRIDSLGPTVTSQSLRDGSIIAPGDHAVEIEFSEPLDDSSISPLAFSLRGSRSLTSVLVDAVYDEDSRTVTLALDDLAEDSYSLIVNHDAAGIRDVAGNSLNETRIPESARPHVIDFIVDHVQPQSTRLERALPLGSLVSRASAIAWLHGDADIDSFVVNPSAGRTTKLHLAKGNPDATVTVTFNDSDYVLQDVAARTIDLDDVPFESMPLQVRSDMATELAWQLIEGASIETNDDDVPSFDVSMPVAGGIRYALIADLTPQQTIRNELLVSNSSYTAQLDPMTLAQGERTRNDRRLIYQAYNGREFFELDADVVTGYSLNGVRMSRTQLGFEAAGIAADLNHLYVLNRSDPDNTIFVFDLETGNAIDYIQPRIDLIDVAVSGRSLFLLTVEGVHEYDLDSRTLDRFYAVPFGGPESIAVTGEDIYVQRETRIDQIPRAGGPSTTHGLPRSALATSTSVTPDVDRHEIPTSQYGPMTVMFATTDARPFDGQIRIEDQNGQALDTEFESNLASNQFVASIPPDHQETLWVVVESDFGFEYSMVITDGVAIDESVTGADGTMDTPTEQFELAVIHDAAQAWVATSREIIEYDVSSWLPARVVTARIASGFDAITTDGGRLYVNGGGVNILSPADFTVLETLPNFSSSGFEFADSRLFTSNEIVDVYGEAPSEQHPWHSGGPNGIAIADQIGRVFKVNRRVIEVYQYAANSEELIDTIALDFQPTGVEFANGHLYVTNSDGGLHVLEPLTGQPVERIQFDFDGVRGMTITDEILRPDQYVVADTNLSIEQNVDVWGEIVLTLASKDHDGIGRLFASVQADSGDSEVVELIELESGVFRAGLPTGVDSSGHSDGVLTVEMGDIVRAHFVENHNDQSVTYEASARINELSEKTPPTRRFHLESGQSAIVRIDRIDQIVGGALPTLVAGIYGPSGDVMTLSRVDDESNQIALTANQPGEYLLHLDVAGHGTIEVVTSVRLVSPDVNGDGVADGADIDAVCAAVHAATPRAELDLNLDGTVSYQDVAILASLLEIPVGDANFDGQFDSRDLIAIFSAAEYEDSRALNSTWSTGDWNCDGDFETGDLVVAFQANTYVAAAWAHTIAAALDDSWRLDEAGKSAARGVTIGMTRRDPFV